MSDCDKLRAFLVENNLDADGIEDKFARFLTLYEDFNSKINVSSIRDREGIYIKHFLDSIFPYKHFSGSCADVGCGGGFPCVPLCIVNPSLRFVAIDSVGKKLALADNAAKELGLNLTTLHSRAENVTERFDTVTARAVSSFDNLLAWCMPLVKKGGKFIAYKTVNDEPPPPALQLKHGVKNLNVIDYSPDGTLNRRLFVFGK